MARNSLIFKVGTPSRAIEPYGRFGVGQSAEVPQPIHRPYTHLDIGLPEIRELARNCNAVRKSIDALTDYIFSEGWEFVPRFSRRCRECEHDHDAEAVPEECENCEMTQEMWEASARDGEWFIEPDEDERERAEDFFTSVDTNRHTLQESLKMFNEILEEVDDGFMVARIDYELRPDGSVEGGDLQELFVPQPEAFKIVAHPQTLEPGGRWKICLHHRPKPNIFGYRAVDDEDTYDAPSSFESRDNADRTVTLQPRASTGGRVYEDPDIEYCTHRNPDGSKCGMRLYDVWYVNTVPESVGDAHHDIIEYYVGPDPETGFPGEVIHTSKYHHGYGYGYPPLVSVYNMGRTLVAMERFMRDWYENQRTPRGAIFFNTNDPASIMPVFEQAENIYRSQGGGYIPKFAVYNKDGGDPVKFIDFSNLPEELQFQEVRDEFYRRIGSAWGVAPVFHGNVDAVGLQNQGPTQWQVTKQAAEWGQWIYNHKVFPHLLDLMGIEDWDLELCPVDPEADLDDQQLRLMKVNEAMQLQQLGFEVVRRTEDGDFEFSEEPSEELLEQMQGGLPSGRGGGFGTGMGAIGGGGQSFGPPPIPGGDTTGEGTQQEG